MNLSGLLLYNKTCLQKKCFDKNSLPSDFPIKSPYDQDPTLLPLGTKHRKCKGTLLMMVGQVKVRWLHYNDLRLDPSLCVLGVLGPIRSKSCVDQFKYSSVCSLPLSPFNKRTNYLIFFSF